MKLKSVAYLCKTLAVVGLLTPSLGLPFSIGEIQLNSALNQAVIAEFKLNLAEGENPSDISVRLATPEKFEQAGIAWNQFLLGLQFQTTNQNNGSVTVKVSSKEPLIDSALSLLVEVSSSQGTQVKAFTAQTASVVNQTPLVLPVTTDSTGESIKPVKKVAGFNPESLNAAGTEYGPLKASDTLWSIAAHLGKERGLSTKQMLTALQKANPDAFNNGSIDSLKPAAVLQIPTAETAIALTSKQPTIEATPAIKNKALELKAPTETTTSDKTEVGSQAKSEPQPELNPSTPPVIANSPATSNSDYLALQTKITALEQQLSMMQQLLALKDQQLAILQNANKNQFALANPPQQIKSESEQSLWLIASLGLSVLTGLGWLLWRKNQQAQQQQRDVEAIFATDVRQSAPAINDGFSFDSIATPNQASANKSDFDFDLEFFEAPTAVKITDANASDWSDADDENETKIDLAKAYIDMGDLEMAKIIAEEVIKTGNQQQKAQAEALLTDL